MNSRDPGFQPQSLFDFGSGSGSALWSRVLTCLYVFVIALLTMFCSNRASKSSWNPKHIKEVFCVDSSIDMNMALALLQGGVYPSNQEETGEINSSPIQKDLYFRQFMPTSSAVRFTVFILLFISI
jgi:hypothetical protein